MQTAIAVWIPFIMRVHGVIAYLRAFAGVALAISAASAQADCDTRSGEQTAALVELYTSQGCSSCPPADRRLAELAPDAAIVPLALHVDYWDELGWKDHYAQADFALRQQWLVAATGQNTVYTPQFFVAGNELRDWRDDLRREVRAINARPASASLHIEAHPYGESLLAVNVEAQLKPGQPPASLFLALTEDGLESVITRGENAGSHLHHEHVVRQWLGPIAVPAGGLSLSRNLQLADELRPDRMTVVAFVQEARSGRVLQALGATQCAKS